MIKLRQETDAEKTTKPTAEQQYKQDAISLPF